MHKVKHINQEGTMDAIKSKQITKYTMKCCINCKQKTLCKSLLITFSSHKVSEKLHHLPEHIGIRLKQKVHSSATAKPPRTVQELPLKELRGEGAGLVELFHSGLVKLPKSIRYLEADEFKACGHTFLPYLDRNATWQSLTASHAELTLTHFGVTTHSEPLSATCNGCCSVTPHNSWNLTTDGE